MSRSDLERLRDAREFAYQALNHAIGLEADILAGALQPQHAALYALAVVGEALSGVSREVRSAAPDIPRNAITSLRHHIVHGYWQIDLEIIAGVIEDRVKPLIAELDKLIALVERMEQ
jgi:uncharacterized protein with HEPN domain